MAQSIPENDFTSVFTFYSLIKFFRRHPYITANDSICHDSLLSVTASVIRILKFILALIIGFYARLQALKVLRKIDHEIVQAIRSAQQSFEETRMLEEYIIEELYSQTGKFKQ